MWAAQIWDSETGVGQELHCGAAATHPTASFAEIKSVFTAYVSGFVRDTSQLSFAPIENPSFIRGRVAAGFLGGKRVAVLGELHPEVITNFELEYPVVAFEVNIGTFQTER